MADDRGKVQVILEDGSYAVIVRGGIKVEFNSNGNAVVHTNGDVKVLPAANDDGKAKIAPQIGDLDDGGVYVGLSAENGKPLHAALADLPEYLTYEEALAAAEQLKSLHPTAHVPTPEELDKNLFDNRNTGYLKDTFNTSGTCPGSVYLSSAPYDDSTARVQWFGLGFKYFSDRDYRLPVRLVW